MYVDTGNLRAQDPTKLNGKTKIQILESLISVYKYVCI